jgi:hypothetical protein
MAFVMWHRQPIPMKKQFFAICASHVFALLINYLFN